MKSLALLATAMARLVQVLRPDLLRCRRKGRRVHDPRSGSSWKAISLNASSEPPSKQVDTARLAPARAGSALQTRGKTSLSGEAAPRSGTPVCLAEVRPGLLRTAVCREMGLRPLEMRHPKMRGRSRCRERSNFSCI